MRELSFLEIVVPLMWVFCLIPAEIYRNYYIIEVLKKRPVYALSVLYRIIAMVLLNLLMVRGISIELTCLMVASFAVFFDPILNKVRKKKSPLLYLNRTTGGWHDDLFVKMGDGVYQVYLVGEVLFLMLSIQTYLIGWDGFVSQLNGTYDWSNYLW
jgi:hypothetical protein